MPPGPARDAIPPEKLLIIFIIKAFGSPETFSRKGFWPSETLFDDGFRFLKSGLTKWIFCFNIRTMKEEQKLKRIPYGIKFRPVP